MKTLRHLSLESHQEIQKVRVVTEMMSLIFQMMILIF